MKDGPSSIFAMAGADMSYLWDMCSKLFRTIAIEEDELVPGQFDSPPAKRLCAEVEEKGKRPRLVRLLG